MKYTKTFLLLVIITILSACKTNTRRTVYYQGIYADDSTGLEGLYNPERGFRLLLTKIMFGNRRNILILLPI